MHKQIYVQSLTRKVNNFLFNVQYQNWRHTLFFDKFLNSQIYRNGTSMRCIMHRIMRI